MRTRFLALVPALVLASCGFADSVDPPEQFYFEGTFEPLTDEFPDLGGNVAALTRGSVITVSFSIHGLEPETEVSWLFAEGVCDTPGGVVVDPGLFPPFEADQQGRIQTGRNGGAQPPGEPGGPEAPGADPLPNPEFLGNLRPDNRYLIQLFEGDSAEGDPIGCADLGEGEDPGDVDPPGG